MTKLEDLDSEKKLLIESTAKKAPARKKPASRNK
jgi:hypothetical protein